MPAPTWAVVESYHLESRVSSTSVYLQCDSYHLEKCCCLNPYTIDDECGSTFTERLVYELSTLQDSTETLQKLYRDSKKLYSNSLRPIAA